MVVLFLSNHVFLLSGPRPTISSPSPEVEERERAPQPPEEFVCPVFSRDARSGRNWRAFPDPSSCRYDAHLDPDLDVSGDNIYPSGITTSAWSSRRGTSVTR